MQTTDDIIFESRDVEIFNIPDTKTKLNTLQNYFFPRLQRLFESITSLLQNLRQYCFKAHQHTLTR